MNSNKEYKLCGPDEMNSNNQSHYKGYRNATLELIAMLSIIHDPEILMW